MKIEPNSSEIILDDDYPVFPGYYYIADGEVVESPIRGTVAALKRDLGVKEIRRFDFQRDKKPKEIRRFDFQRDKKRMVP